MKTMFWTWFLEKKLGITLDKTQETRFKIPAYAKATAWRGKIQDTRYKKNTHRN